MSGALPCIHSRGLLLVLYATSRIVLGASLAVSPWTVRLRVDADQYLTPLVRVVQNASSDVNRTSVKVSLQQSDLPLEIDIY